MTWGDDMLVRVMDTDSGLVHFVNPANAGFTLCARTKGTDLLGKRLPIGRLTSDLVTCPDCAKVVCAIRNEPYNTLESSFDETVFENGIYDAVKPPTEVVEPVKTDEKSHSVAFQTTTNESETLC